MQCLTQELGEIHGIQTDNKNVIGKLHSKGNEVMSKGKRRTAHLEDFILQFDRVFEGPDIGLEVRETDRILSN